MLEAAVIILALLLVGCLCVGIWFLSRRQTVAHDPAAHKRIDDLEEAAQKQDERLNQVEGLSRGVIRLLDDMKNQRATQQQKTVEEVRNELGKMMGMGTATKEEKFPPQARPAASYPQKAL